MPTVEENLRAEAEVIADLRAVGLDIEHLTEFLQTSEEYPEAVPVLLDWLERTSNGAVKDTIVRALTATWVRGPTTARILAQFPLVDDPTGLGTRWVIGNAMEVLADDSVFDELVRYATDRTYGRGREMLVLSLWRMKRRRDEAITVLRRLLDDDEVVGHALMALRKMNARDARSDVAKLLDHPNTWIRAEAKKAVNRFDK